jgi:hypothetical protein
MAFILSRFPTRLANQGLSSVTLFSRLYCYLETLLLPKREPTVLDSSAGRHGIKHVGCCMQIASTSFDGLVLSEGYVPHMTPFDVWVM